MAEVMAEVLWPGHGSSIIIVSFTGSDLGTWLCLTAKLEEYIIPQRAKCLIQKLEVTKITNSRSCIT